MLEFYKQRRPAALVDETFLETVSLEAGGYVQGLDRRMEMLGECLSRLPDKDRQLIDLRYRGSQSVEVVAQKVGRTASAVYKALARIRESLLDCISRKLTERDAS